MRLTGIHFPRGSGALGVAHPAKDKTATTNARRTRPRTIPVRLTQSTIGKERSHETVAPALTEESSAQTYVALFTK